MGTQTFLTLTKTTMLVLFRCPVAQIRVSAWSGGSLPHCWINSWNARRTRTPSRPVQLNKFQTSIIYLSWLCKCVFRKRCWLLHWLSCGNGVSVRFTLVRILTDVRDRFCKYVLFSKINILNFKKKIDTFVDKKCMIKHLEFVGRRHSQPVMKSFTASRFKFVIWNGDIVAHW